MSYADIFAASNNIQIMEKEIAFGFSLNRSVRSSAHAGYIYRYRMHWYDEIQFDHFCCHFLFKRSLP